VLLFVGLYADTVPEGEFIYCEVAVTMMWACVRWGIILMLHVFWGGKK